MTQTVDARRKAFAHFSPIAIPAMGEIKFHRFDIGWSQQKKMDDQLRCCNAFPAFAGMTKEIFCHPR
ncbi:MAG: hypothetical protein ABI082_12100 [Dokdonella sp.]